MESLGLININFWKNKRVLVTGNTGFKGSWLSIILNYLGAKTCGISLKPKKISLFTCAELSKKSKNLFFDMKNINTLRRSIRDYNPEIIFHLAAQPIVSIGYEKPRYTINNNLMSTLNLLEILRISKKPCTVIISTTDKVYFADNKNKNFVETDLLKSDCPYASSKIMVENLVSCYANSFFDDQHMNIGIARSGNVIGGGDWAENRLIPDLIRAWRKKKKLNLRMPFATRPWVHVLEPLLGYMQLAESMFKNKKNMQIFNFGPDIKNITSVSEMIIKCKKVLPSLEVFEKNSSDFTETKFLMLNSNKAKRHLGFRNIWNIDKSIDETIKWYKLFYQGKNAYQLCIDNIEDYISST